MFDVSSSSTPPLIPPENGSGDLPRTFGRYTLFEKIGRGGMAQIYLARAESEFGATRRAVVKQILPAFAEDPRFSEMLIHEAKLAARLNHRRIVQVFDLGREKDCLYIAMEYVEGFDLNVLLRQCTEKKIGLPAKHALGIVADLLEGLDYAHRRPQDDGASLGIVHRDVSPSNVLISYEGEVKLCDFGIAHANDLVKEGTTDALKGKAGYMSPEHARGEEIDSRADVFAVGIVLWELLAGKRLYTPKSDVSLIVQAQRASIPPVPDRGLPNPEKLSGIVMRALTKDRQERYPTTGAMLSDLEEYLAESDLLASRLKLGAWIESTFGTSVVADRRASERRLPKSQPPSPAAEDDREEPETIDAIAVARPTFPPRISDIPFSAGAMRAFKRELAQASMAPPESLEGAAMDVAASPTTLTDTDESSPPPTVRTEPAVAGLLTRPRAIFALTAFTLLVALLVGLVCYLIQ
jgi:serine/threonine-protein kinase